VGPNNAGKSTVIDLIRLLARGSTYDDSNSGNPFRIEDELFELDFHSGDHRLSSFDQLITTGKETLVIETQFDHPFGRDPAIQIENGISIRRKYKDHGDSARLREIVGFLLPPGSAGESDVEDKSTRKRIFHVEFEYRKRATPGHPSFEIPTTYPEHWEAEYDFESGDIRFEHMEKEVIVHESGSEESSLETEVSFEAKLEPPLIKIALDYTNALLARQGKPRIDATPQVARAEADYDETTPFTPKFFGSQFINALELPDGWPPDYEDGFWKLLKNQALSPLATSINKASRFSVTYAPSFRASGQAYYGSSDPLTDLLQSFDREDSSVRRQVNHWIEELDLGRDLQVDRKGPSLYEATLERNGVRRSLVDCGSGVSQLLPLILQFTQAGRGDILLAEEPEANLHPDLQARLADLFGELAKSRAAIVETHSEYFVRRIQYLVARGGIDPDQVQVLYVEPPTEESSSQIRPISVDEKGQLSEPFGPGFFDQATDLMVDLFKYGTEN
jgi:hypothetical protein